MPTERNAPLQFSDRATLDTKTKRVVSMRDGVLEYLGAELGREPEDAVFTVYRSPATVANAAMKTTGLPIVDGHVSTQEPAPDTGSYITDSLLVEQLDEALDATLAAAHTAEVTQDLVASIQSGKREVSLGYTAELAEHHKYDFEQVNVEPHHLSAEESGRCGPSCSFVDHRKPVSIGDNTMVQKTNFPQAFLDENGEVNMQKIVEIASALPEAIKSVPVDKLQEVMPQLQELVSMASEGREQGADESTGDEETPAVEGDSGDYDEEGMEDKGMKDKAPEKEQGYTDAQVRKFADARVQAEVKRHASVIDKARRFLDESYDFTDKSTEQIMRDAVATETTESFEDSELPMAFKMLKPTQHRKEVETFGDRNPDAASKLSQLANEEL